MAQPRLLSRGTLATLGLCLLLAGSAIAETLGDDAAISARQSGVWEARPGDRLDEIAALLLPEDAALQQRLIIDLRETYPDAIIDRNTGDLRGGTLLKLPDYALISRTTKAAPDSVEQPRAVARVSQAGAGLRASGTDGRVRPLATNGALAAGETLLSGPGVSQLQLLDGSRLSLRPHSVLRLGSLPAEDAEPSEPRQLQLLRGGIRLSRDAAASFVLAAQQAELLSHTQQLSLRLCSSDCLRADGERRPAGLYAKAGDGELQLRSPAGEQRFTAGLWLHLPLDGEPAVALNEQPEHGFAVPNGEQKRIARSSRTLDARTLAQYSKRLTPLVYQAIASPTTEPSEKPSADQTLMSFSAGKQPTLINLKSTARSGEDSRLWLKNRQTESEPTRTGLQTSLPRSPFNQGRRVEVPRYTIKSPSLPPAHDPLWVESALGRQRPAAMLGGLCLGGHCDEAQSRPLRSGVNGNGNANDRESP